MPAVRAWRAPVAIALAVIALDQLTKHWAVTSLGTDREIDLFWTLRLNLAFNNGMAFGQGQGFGPVIAVIATVVIVYLLVSLQTEASRPMTIRFSAHSAKGISLPLGLSLGLGGFIVLWIVVALAPAEIEQQVKALLLGAEKLVYLTDIEGLRRVVDDPSSTQTPDPLSGLHHGGSVRSATSSSHRTPSPKSCS